MPAPEIPEEQADTGKKKRGPSRNLPIAAGVGVGLGAVVLLSLYTVKEIFLGVVVLFLGRRRAGSSSGRSRRAASGSRGCR